MNSVSDEMNKTIEPHLDNLRKNLHNLQYGGLETRRRN